MIKTVGIHHFGGLAANPKASTQHLTEANINDAHRARWPDFPSKLNGSFIGYNIIIYKNGKWSQYRALGEETAAIKGRNSDTFNIALAGNFTKGVDTPTEEQIQSLSKILKALVNNYPASIGIVVSNSNAGYAQYSFSIQEIKPHRLLSPVGYTECNGNALPDDWARSFAMPTAVIADDTSKKAVLGIIDQIILLISKLRDMLAKAPALQLGSEGDRDDESVML